MENKTTFFVMIALIILTELDSMAQTNNYFPDQVKVQNGMI